MRGRERERVSEREREKCFISCQLAHSDFTYSTGNHGHFNNLRIEIQHIIIQPLPAIVNLHDASHDMTQAKQKEDDVTLKQSEQ